MFSTAFPKSCSLVKRNRALPLVEAEGWSLRMLKLGDPSLVYQAPVFIVLVYIINLFFTLASQSIYSLLILIKKGDDAEWGA